MRETSSFDRSEYGTYAARDLAIGLVLPTVNSQAMKVHLEHIRKLWRVQEGRKEDPSAVVVDSQSVKTTEKGGSKDMMELKR